MLGDVSCVKGGFSTEAGCSLAAAAGGGKTQMQLICWGAEEGRCRKEWREGGEGKVL